MSRLSFSSDTRWTRHAWLTTRLLILGADVFTATEAVASTLLAHPEWDPDEKRTWDEWEGLDD